MAEGTDNQEVVELFDSEGNAVAEDKYSDYEELFDKDGNPYEFESEEEPKEEPEKGKGKEDPEGDAEIDFHDKDKNGEKDKGKEGDELPDTLEERLEYAGVPMISEDEPDAYLNLSMDYLVQQGLTMDSDIVADALGGDWEGLLAFAEKVNTTEARTHVNTLKKAYEETIHAEEIKYQEIEKRNVNTAVEFMGGKEELQSIIDWSKDNLKEEEYTEYMEQMRYGNTMTIPVLVALTQLREAKGDQAEAEHNRFNTTGTTNKRSRSGGRMSKKVNEQEFKRQYKELYQAHDGNYHNLRRDPKFQELKKNFKPTRKNGTVQETGAPRYRP